VHSRSLTHRLPWLAVFAASPALAGEDRLVSAGDLIRFNDRIPAGATASVEVVYDATGDTRVTLRAWGLEPRTEYGVHLHAAPCGVSRGASGPSYQHIPNPRPDLYRTDPDYVNDVNEVWLDLTTDASGRAVSTTTQPWQFSPGGGARSVIIHEEHTRTGPLDAGHAGRRLGCLDVNL
jgi:superoxide dismutase, Cu-Zn family